jgi:hypothetical protein
MPPSLAQSWRASGVRWAFAHSDDRESGKVMVQDHAVEKIPLPKMKRKIYETELRKLQVHLCRSG